jgi:GNAT superfamily N-acetyltransferase
MRIRNITVDDFFLLNELDWTPLPKERDSIYLTMALDQQPCSFIAEDDGGEFLGVLLASRGAQGESIYINHLLIAPSARKMGLGSRLMAALEDYATGVGVRRVWFHCQDETVEYYQGKGYRESYDFLSPSLEKYLRETKQVHTMSKMLKKN